jgi:hypothetical protein
LENNKGVRRRERTMTMGITRHLEVEVDEMLKSHREDREKLGQRVRRQWVKWAREQEDPKESWLAPWEELDEPMKEVDRRIGEAVYNTGFNQGYAEGVMYCVRQSDRLYKRPNFRVYLWVIHEESRGLKAILAVTAPSREIAKEMLAEGLETDHPDLLGALRLTGEELLESGLNVFLSSYDEGSVVLRYDYDETVRVKEPKAAELDGEE